MRVPVVNSENRAFDDTKGQKLVHLNLNLSSVKALVVIFYYETDSVELKKTLFFCACCFKGTEEEDELHNYRPPALAEHPREPVHENVTCKRVRKVAI